METSTYLSYGALGLGVLAFCRAVIGVTRRVVAEKELIRRISDNEEFRRLENFLESERAAGRINPNEYWEIQKNIAMIFDREFAQLTPEKRRLVDPGLHQSSGQGRSSYVAKLEEKSKKRSGLIATPAGTF